MKNLILFICTCLAFTASAQVEVKPLMLKSKPVAEGLRIKVLPGDAQTWLQSIEKGFDIVRYTLQTQGEEVKNLTPEPLKPAVASSFPTPDLGEAQNEFLWKALEGYKKLVAEGKQYQAGIALEEVYGYYLLLSTRESEVSERSGMEFTDKSVEEGKFYRYEIRIAGTEKSKATFTSFIYAGSREESRAPGLYAQIGDGEALLQWEHRVETSPYLAFHIERSLDGKSFTRLTENPIYTNESDSRDSSLLSNKHTLYYRDSLLENDKKYFYRSVGLDYFGDLSLPSAVTELIPFDQTAPSLPIGFRAEITGEKQAEKIKLSWKKETKEEDFTGYLVLRAGSEGEYKPVHQALLATDSNEFVDESALPGVPYYYSILVTDKYQNYQVTQIQAATLPDYLPPSIPTGIQAEISDKGVVTLNWENNTEADLKGYRVFASNHKDSDYLSLTPVPLNAPSFTDTLSLNRLNEEHYYRLVSLDNYYNHSDYSEVITVRIPDTIAPSAPRHLQIKNKNGKATFSWKPSGSQDVVAQKLQQYNPTDRTWTDLKEWTDNNTNSYQIKGDAAGNFRLIAVDDAGLISTPSNTFSIASKEVQVPATITDLSAKTDEKGINLSWKEARDNPTQQYLIYKAENEEKARLFRSVNTPEFTDTAVKTGIEYKYFIVTQDKRGRKSPRSASVKAKVK